MNEVSEVSDSVTILRDGKTIETLDMKSKDMSEDRIIRGMVGRDLTDRYPERKPNIGEVMLEVKDWTVYHEHHADRKVLDGVNLNVRRGEIVGIAGLMGAGRTELAMSIFGKAYGQKISGELRKEGQVIHNNTINQAIDNGFAYVTEDRKDYGLVLIQDIKRNISLTGINKLQKASVINENEEVIVAEQMRKRLKIKTNSIHQEVQNLSGGNQQKVVLSKWIYSEPDILILDEPTRGIDVGAKFEIYSIIQELANEGKAIIVISSELPEILGICDRIFVMNAGRITGEVDRSEANQELLMKYMTKTTRSGGHTNG